MGEGLLHTGSCLCGSVRYTVRGPVRDIWACHCRFCRRLHSHVAAYAACAPEDITIGGIAADIDGKARAYGNDPNEALRKHLGELRAETARTSRMPSAPLLSSREMVFER